jgi:ABC-2 type transport system ATP-binding protein
MAEDDQLRMPTAPPTVPLAAVPPAGPAAPAPFPQPPAGQPPVAAQPPAAAQSPSTAPPLLPQYPGRQELAAATQGTAVVLRGLRKVYDGRAVVDSIDLDVPTGSFFGLVGPNGAGKTTTLSMVTGLLRPDAGRVLLAGTDVWQDPVGAKAKMGVLPDGLRLFERLSGLELLSYLGRLRGIDAATVRARAEELLAVLDLAGDGNKLVADYSTGMRKKITLAAALLHSPPVLLLDEPLEAVDPVSARIIRTVLTRFTTGGGTVIFSSHVMALVEELCTHVAVMAGGRIVASGDLATVRGSARNLDDAFLHLVGADNVGEGGLEWLGSSRA